MMMIMQKKKRRDNLACTNQGEIAELVPVTITTMMMSITTKKGEKKHYRSNIHDNLVNRPTHSIGKEEAYPRHHHEEVESIAITNVIIKRRTNRRIITSQAKKYTSNNPPLIANDQVYEATIPHITIANYTTMMIRATPPSEMHGVWPNLPSRH